MIPLLLLLAVGGLMQAARSFTADASVAGTELAFGFLLLAAYFTAKLANRFGLPKLTGYLIAGVVAGPFVLDLVTNDMATSLKVVNGSATCILGLTAGAELNLRKVKPVMATIRLLMVLGVVGVMFVLAALLFVIRPLLPFFDGMSATQSIAVCILLGVALTPQSPAVVMALLSETHADGPLSQILLASVVVADLVVILCYAIAAAVTGAMIGGGVDVVETALSVSWELLGSVAFGIAIGMLIGAFVRSVKQGAPMFALLICVVVAEIGSRIHLDPLIVMLTAGIWLENFSGADASSMIHGFESAQLPVFLVWFALSGTHLDLPQLWGWIIPVMILAVGRAGWFYISAKLAAVRTGAAPAVVQYAWIGLIPQAGLSLALMVVIQISFPTFGGKAAVIMLSLMGVNQMIAPVLLRTALIRSGEAGQKQSADFAADDRAVKATH
jgi:Kef-type K+ transport system membrane component KefB